MKDTNKFVNKKDFGVIARSSRGSNTPTQVGDQNQIETGRTKLRSQSWDKKSRAEVKKSSGSGLRDTLRAGGSKNLSPRETYEKRMSTGKYGSGN